MEDVQHGIDNNKVNHPFPTNLNLECVRKGSEVRPDSEQTVTESQVIIAHLCPRIYTSPLNVTVIASQRTPAYMAGHELQLSLSCIHSTNSRVTLKQSKSPKTKRKYVKEGPDGNILNTINCLFYLVLMTGSC